MAIAHDTATRSSATVSSGDASWSHTAAAGAKGAVVLIAQTGSALDKVDSVLYGGVAMHRRRYDAWTGTEPGAVYAYVLDRGWPGGGTQTVQVNVDATNPSWVGYAATLTADGDIAIDVAASADGALADPSLTLDYADGLAEWVAYYVIYTSANAPVTTVEAGATHVFGNDHGTTSSMLARKSGAGGTSTTIGYTLAASNLAHAGVIVKEASPSQYGPMPVRRFTGGADVMTLGSDPVARIRAGGATVAVVARRLDESTYAPIWEAANPSFQSQLDVGLGGPADSFRVVAKNIVHGSIDVRASDGWVLLVVSKPAGGTSRAHKYVYATGAWAHANFASSWTQDPDLSCWHGWCQIGGNTTEVEWFSGDMAVVGVWAERGLSDAEIETLPYELRAWVDLRPSTLLPLDQPTRDTPIVDIVGRLGGSGQNFTVTKPAVTGTMIVVDGPPMSLSLPPVLPQLPVAPPAAGGPVTLEGIAPAAADLDGDLAVARPLEANAAAAADLAGALGVTRPLGGTAAAAAGLTGDLSIQGAVPLAGTIPASADLLATLSTMRSLAGAAAAASSASADLAVARPLAVSIPAAATAVGTLASTVNPPPLWVEATTGTTGTVEAAGGATRIVEAGGGL